MKAKVKFDSAQLKAFLLHHVEKLVFGGFVVAFLLICWSAFKLKPYEKTPADLKKLADDVSQQVEAKTPPDKFTGLPSVPNFTQNLGSEGPAIVNPGFYTVKALNRPYEDRQERRKEPKFFALAEPLVFPGYGGIAIGETGAVNRVANFGSGMTNEAGAPSGPGMMGSGMMGSGMDGMSGPGMSGPGMSGPMSGPGMSGPMSGPGMSGPMSGPGMSGPMSGPGMSGPGMMGPGGMAAGRGAARGRGRSAQSRNQRNNRTAPQAEQRPIARPKPQSTEKIVLTNPPANSHVEGRYWVCLVGAVPYWKQLNEYQTTFRDARYYEVTRDYPRYALPIIERAEVNGSDAGDWEELNVEEAVDDLLTWAADYPEVVDKQFLDPYLTEPLPPLVFANHDKEKVSHPGIKMAEKPVVAPTQEGKKKPKKRALSGAVAGNRNGGAGMQGAGPGTGGGYGGGAYSGYAKQMGGAQGTLVERRLFRFFDFTVEPGKTYRYRVKLVLRNPNLGVPPRFLDNYDFGKGETREADWSQPSPDVAVIAGNRLLAGGVTQPSRSEPSAKVLAKLFDAKLAAEIRRIFDISRGSVLNERNAKVGLPKGGGEKEKEVASLDFETNAVVLDMFGGDKIPGARAKDPRAEQPKIPGHILVLDNDGDLRTLVQSTDAGMYETEVEEAHNQAPPAEGNPKDRAGGSSSPLQGFDNFDSIPAGGSSRGRR
jgi:hypothetical protein